MSNKPKSPSLDETYVPSDEPKLNPYDRLQSIFSEKNAGKLTSNASEKLDFLLNENQEPSFFQKALTKVRFWFNKIDSKIFKPKSKIGTTFQRRAKVKNKWT